MQYHLLHALALVATGGLGSRFEPRRLAFAGLCFAAGILLFSGSLYLMAFTGIDAGYLTPLGGMGFLGGWLAMAVAGLRLR